MIVVEVLGIGLAASLFSFAMLALWIGLLAAVGAVRLVRCQRCGHLGMASPHQPLLRCGRCRHSHLLHPLATLHHDSGEACRAGGTRT